MPDYSLGRAHGRVDITYDGSDTRRAADDLDRLTLAALRAQLALRDMGRELDNSSNAAQRHSHQMRDLHQRTRDLDDVERNRIRTLRDSRDEIDRLRDSHIRLTNSHNDHNNAVHNLMGSMGNLHNVLNQLNNMQNTVANGQGRLIHNLGTLSHALSLFGPYGRAAGLGLNVVVSGMNDAGGSARANSEHIKNFVKNIASFEVKFAKISGLALGLPSLAGLAGIGGASALNGLVAVADAVKQLSGLLGLLPAAVSGAAFSMATLKIAFHGVGDAIKDMMADDPKAFLEDIAQMAPAAAQSMVQIAQFRDMFKMAGGAIQESFFTKVVADIAPLIQTWLPAVTSGMSQVAGIFGDFAHQFAGILAQPATMAAFTEFIQNITAGLRALQPALGPLVSIFTTLVDVGSSFFAQIGTSISGFVKEIADSLNFAAGSGELQAWIQDGINAFGHLVRIVEHVGSAFMEIMDVAEKFGGGGLLAWLEKVTDEFDKWAQSAEGQQALSDFFSTLNTATQAFLPMLKPLVEGIASIAQAFVLLGIGIAPGWQDVFNTFRDVMAQLGPQIVGLGPALNTFLTGMAKAFADLMAQVGPQLPQIFSTLANAFVALLPQIGPITNAFIQLVERVGPQLPKFFQAVTDMLTALIPYLPTVIGLVRDFVSALTMIVEAGPSVLDFIKGFVEGLGNVSGLGMLVKGAMDLTNKIFDAFKDLPTKAEGWGRSILDGLWRGMMNVTGVGMITQATKGIVDQISSWFQHSPAKQGPFSGTGYTRVRGQMMVQDMAAGMTSAHGEISAAAASTAAAAASGLSKGGSGAGAPFAAGMEGAGGALLPDNIAGADVSILDTYLRHEFSDGHGLKGLARDLGGMLNVFQSGAGLANYAQQALQSLTQMPGFNQQAWKKKSAEELAQEAAKKAAQQGPQWHPDVLGGVGGGSGGLAATHSAVGGSMGRLSAGASVRDKQLAIISKGKSLGLSDQEIQGILGVAQEESRFNDVGFMGFGPEAKANGINIDQDPQAAIDLFFKNYMAGGLGSGGPTKASVVGPGGQINDQQQWIQFLWHRMQGAADPDYARKLAAAIDDQTKLYPSLLGQMGTPSNWTAAQGSSPFAGMGSTGGGAGGAGVPRAGLPPGTKVGADGSLAFPQGVLPPGTNIAGAPGISTIQANPASRAATMGGASANYTPSTMAAAGIAPLFTKSAPGSMAGAPAWVTQLAAAFNLTASSHADSTLHGGVGQMGDWAFDFGSPTGNADDMQRFADFIRANLASQTLQAIWQNPHTGAQLGIAGGQILGSGQYYTTAGGSYADHTDHVHWATDVPVLMNGQLPPGSMAATGGVSPLGIGTMAGHNGNLMLPSGQPLSQFIDPATGKAYSADEQLLQQYLQGNPALAAQINAAKNGPMSDQDVLSTLSSIDTAITGLKAQDAVGNQNTISALQSTQQKIAQDAGFQQGPNSMQAFASMMGGGANAISGVLQAFQGGLDALAGTQDIADRLVYGVRNTEDVNAIIDNVQKYITFASQVASAAGSILSLAGSASGGMDMGGAAAAGQAAQMISGLLQGVNAAIDFGQMIYHITGSYVGKLLSQMVAGPLGTPLMGDVRFLLNTNTGYLNSYSQDNPGNQNSLAIPPWIAQALGYGGGNQNPQVNQELNVYAGPGQPAHEMLREVVWMANTAGPANGAMAPQNF